MLIFGSAYLVSVVRDDKKLFVSFVDRFMSNLYLRFIQRPIFHQPISYAICFPFVTVSKTIVKR